MLPALDTVCFDAMLPLSSRRLEQPAALPRETLLALRVLAAPEVREDDPDASVRLEAKLDLMLEIALKLRHPQRPSLRTCRVGLNALAWEDSETYQPGSEVELQLYPHADSSLALYLPLTIAQADFLPDGALYLGELKPVFSEHARQLWEKWVFRCHRRALQKR